MSGDGTIYQFTAQTINGMVVPLSIYRGKVVLIVNVTTESGLSDTNYKRLRELLEVYKNRGLEIAAFPCNQFNGSETHFAGEVEDHIHQDYHFDPDIYQQVNVNGHDAHPLFEFLKHQKGGTLGDWIKWNFTKFLIDRNGYVIGRYGPTTTRAGLTEDMERALQRGETTEANAVLHLHKTPMPVA